jgi:VWFA-related protein
MGGYRCRLVSLVLLPLWVASLHSQTPPSEPAPVPTFLSKVRVVEVDVVVTNDRDEPVSGLHKKDFQVFENGKPQSIASFEEHKGAAPTQIKLPPMPPHVFTNYPTIERADSVNVLLLDSLNTQPQDQAYVRRQLIEYLEHASPGSHLAIFTLASRLRMIQGFTTDFSLLMGALKQKKAGSPELSPLLPTAVQADMDKDLVALMAMNQAAPEAIAAVKQFQADHAANDTTSRLNITLQALAQLARYLSNIPGRKNVIWFSGSFPVTSFPSTDGSRPFQVMHDYPGEVQQTAELLAPGQVAIYPVSAVGLTGDATYEASHVTTPRMQRQNLEEEGADRATNQLAMEELAKATGGHAFYNSNGLGEAMIHALHDGARYYTLSYVPTNKSMDGKYRRIQIELVHTSYKLAYRRGYTAEDARSAQAAAHEPASDPLLPLVKFGMPDFTQILYKIRVLPTNPQPPPEAKRLGSNPAMKGPVTRYGVDFAISEQDLRLDAAPDGVRHGAIEVMLVAYDEEGKPLNFVVTESKILMKSKVYEALEKVGLQLHKEIDVPSGEIYLRTGIYDLNASTAGTLGVPLSAASVPRAQ